MKVPIESGSAIAFVTSGDHKFLAVAASLPNHTVVRIPPYGPDERSLTARLPMDELRSVWVSKAKEENWARDLRGFMAVLFNDVTRIADDVVYEKPNSREEMLDQIMRQSGRTVILRASFTKRSPDRDTQSLIVDAILHARRYSLREVRQLTESIGTSIAMNTAGSLPTEWPLFDRRWNIERKFTHLSGQETVVFERVSWKGMNPATNRSLISGAHPVPLQHLVNAQQ